VRIGLIGVGRWGRNYLRTIAQLDGAVLTAVASRNAETGRLVPTSCRVFADWRDLIGYAGVDAVIVATPPALHAEMVRAALDAGKPVLVEKPLTTSLAELAAIRAAIRERSPAVLVDHTHLNHPAFQRLKTELSARGRIRAIRASAGNHGPYRPDVSVLWDWGPHDVAMCLALGSGRIEPASVERLDQRIIEGARAERIHLSLLADSEVTISIRLSTLDAKHRWFAVDLDDATLIYRDAMVGGLTLHRRPGAGPQDCGTVLAVPVGLPLTAVVADFIATVRVGATRRDSLELAGRVVECLAKCEVMLGSAEGWRR
jgi:predicted dehydrogenase